MTSKKEKPSRRITVIERLPVGELTDEEIVKAAMHRLNARCLVMAYLDEDNEASGMGRWKDKSGKLFYEALNKAWKNNICRFYYDDTED